MRFGFLLRFQESMADERTVKVTSIPDKENPAGLRVHRSAGTKTITEVRQEVADNDPGSRHYYVLPH